jgi:hypothetical protein
LFPLLKEAIMSPQLALKRGSGVCGHVGVDASVVSLFYSAVRIKFRNKVVREKGKDPALIKDL